MRKSLPLVALALVAPLVLPDEAHAGNTLAITDSKLDPPTVISLGLQVLITDDDDRDAKITLRYKPTGSAGLFQIGLPLFRVHSEAVTARTVPQQFAGSI